MKDGILAHLARLVAWDTQNPPRALTTDAPELAYLQEAAGPGFRATFRDHGEGRISLLLIRGAPEVLFNCHLDTVPAGEGWTHPPLELVVEGGRAQGLGACDVKGAAAALLAAASASDAPAALLFTTDEEGSASRCVEGFLEEGEPDPRDDGGRGGHQNFRQVVVAEPTECRAVWAHRGYLSVRGQFLGTAGHSSDPRALEESANHRMGRWVAAAVERCRTLVRDGRPPCFNVGRMDGGEKNNVIASRARITWSARPGPGDSTEGLLEELTSLCSDPVEWTVTFAGPSLPHSRAQGDAARSFAGRMDLPVRPEPVDFWTEASLFAQTGIPALVLGPGSIEQAHAPDEWVALDQLEEAARMYRAIMEADGGRGR